MSGSHAPRQGKHPLRALDTRRMEPTRTICVEQVESLTQLLGLLLIQLGLRGESACGAVRKQPSKRRQEQACWARQRQPPRCPSSTRQGAAVR